jgi:predicted ester cyclase
MTAKTNSKEIVLACVDAINEEDFPAARKFLDDKLSFEGVLGSRRGVDAYLDDMERMRLKYKVKKAVAEGDDVCLLSEMEISGKSVTVSSWYCLTAGKIRSLRVVFDPRPVLEHPSQPANKP